jgi:hypothetical protein
MTDDDLAIFCGLAPGDPAREKFIATLTPERRALFERMAGLSKPRLRFRNGSRASARNPPAC